MPISWPPQGAAEIGEPVNSAPSIPRPFERRAVWGASGLAALIVSAFAVMFAPEFEVPPLDPVGSQAAYRPTDPEARVMIEPTLHAPWRGTPSVSTVWVLAVCVTSVAVLVAMTAGATPAAAWLAAIHLIFLAPFAVSVHHAADQVLAVLLVWLSWTIVLTAVPRGGRAWLLAAAAVWAAAVAMSWLALMALPVLLLAWVRVSATPRARTAAIGGVLLLAATSLWAYVWRMSRLADAMTAAAGPPASMADVWAVAFGDVVRRGDPDFAAPDVGGLSVWSAALVVVALLFANWPRWWRLGLAFSIAILAFMWMEWPAWRPEAVRLAGWASAPLAASGLAWVAAQAPRRWRTPALVAVGILFVGSGAAAALRTPGGDEARAFAQRLASSLHDLRREGPIAIVAEDTLLDSALVAWAGALRLPQHPDVLRPALDRGIDPLAGPSARANLELFGFRFEIAATIGEPAAYALSRVVERLHCATVRADRWSLLPGLEYTGRLGLDVPPGLGGRLLMIVGDDLPLQLRAALASGQAIALSQQALLRGPGSGTPPPDYWFDGGDPALAPQNVTRLAFPAHPLERTLVSLHLGRRAPRTLARLDGYDDAARGGVCAAPLGPDALWSHENSGEVPLPLQAAGFFGVGWHGVEGDASARFRWTSGAAAVLVPSAEGGPVRVSLDAAPAVDPDADGPTLMLRVNNLPEGARRMSSGVSRYEWEVGADRWRPGTNELLFNVSHRVRPADHGAPDTRVLGLRVHGLTLTRE